MRTFESEKQRARAKDSKSEGERGKEHRRERGGAKEGVHTRLSKHQAESAKKERRRERETERERERGRDRNRERGRKREKLR